jgi:hypothetical protein
MDATTVTTPNELEIRVERVFDAPRTHVFSVWTDPQLIPEWWGDGTVVEEMDVRPGGTYRFRTAFGVVEGEFREARRRSARTVRTTCRRQSSRIWRADEADADDAAETPRARHDDAVRRAGAKSGFGDRRGAGDDRTRCDVKQRRTMGRRWVGRLAPWLLKDIDELPGAFGSGDGASTCSSESRQGGHRGQRGAGAVAWSATRPLSVKSTRTTRPVAGLTIRHQPLPSA